MAYSHARHDREVREENLAPGEFISAYRILGLVGTGGMGWVYRAKHALTQQIVAIKVLRLEQLAYERAIERMMREATILASVTHPGIPRFYECGMLEDRRPWIAMELVEGTPLSSLMADGQLMSPRAVLDVITHVSDVLAAAHVCGATHRDLKPDNIFLTPDDVFPVRVIDWGIAHHLAGARLTNVNEAIGTPTYMSPEQARGGPTDGHCDVYGLGVVAYQALCGKPPFSGGSSIEILVQHLNRPVPPLSTRIDDVPPALAALVERMLAKTLEERPSALEVREAAERLIDDRGDVYEDFSIDGVPSHSDDYRTPSTAQFRVQVIED